MLYDLLNEFYAKPTNYSIESHDSGTTLSVDVPGLGSEDVDLTLENSRLYVKSKLKSRPLDISFRLRDPLTPEKIEARVDKGVLYVELQKHEKSGSRQIKVH